MQKAGFRATLAVVTSGNPANCQRRCTLAVWLDFEASRSHEFDDEMKDVTLLSSRVKNPGNTRKKRRNEARRTASIASDQWLALQNRR